jgi:hypothetical protein
MAVFHDSLLTLTKPGIYEIILPEECELYLGKVKSSFLYNKGTQYIHNPVPNNVLYISKPIELTGRYLGYPELTESLKFPEIKTLNKGYGAISNRRLSGNLQNMVLSLKRNTTELNSYFIEAFCIGSSKLTFEGITYKFSGPILIPLVVFSSNLEIYWDLIEEQYATIKFYNGAIRLQS